VSCRSKDEVHQIDSIRKVEDRCCGTSNKFQTPGFPQNPPPDGADHLYREIILNTTGAQLWGPALLWSSVPIRTARGYRYGARRRPESGLELGVSPLSLGDKKTVGPLRRFGCSFDATRNLSDSIKKIYTKTPRIIKAFFSDHIRAWARWALETWPLLSSPQARSKT